MTISSMRFTCTIHNMLDTTVRSFPEDFIDHFICGDAVEMMRQIPDGAVDLVVTSPPYNLKNSTGNGMKDGRGGKWQGAALVAGYSHHHDNMPHAQYVAWQRQCLTEMLRIIPEDGAIFYNHKWRVQGGLLQDRQDIVSDFPVRQIIIWQRRRENLHQGKSASRPEAHSQTGMDHHQAQK